MYGNWIINCKIIIKFPTATKFLLVNKHEKNIR